jgi:hypothetical protein
MLSNKQLLNGISYYGVFEGVWQVSSRKNDIHRFKRTQTPDSNLECHET